MSTPLVRPPSAPPSYGCAPPPRRWRLLVGAVTVALATATAVSASPSPAGAASSPTAVRSGYKVGVVAVGTGIKANPDDIAVLGDHLFVGYQNGVGPLGQPAVGTGQTQSTIVEYSRQGRQIAAFKVTGKCDGLGDDAATGEVLASVNEDGNTSIYAIHPSSGRVVHLTYSPDPSTLGGGGTDAIAVVNGTIFVTGSNPSAATAPAVYTAQLDETTKVATLAPVFADDAAATGPAGPVTLALTDPDTVAAMPLVSPLFAGDVVLNSQGDSQLVFVHNPASTGQTLTQLPIGTQIDDITVATSTRGALFMTDNTADRLYAISTADFAPGTVFVDTANDSATPGFVGTLNLATGQITPVVIGFANPHGLTFVPGA